MRAEKPIRGVDDPVRPLHGAILETMKDDLAPRFELVMVGYNENGAVARFEAGGRIFFVTVTPEDRQVAIVRRQEERRWSWPW